MAIITEIETPYLLGPNPVENCIRFCFMISSLGTKLGVRPRGCMVFSDGAAPFSQGDEIVFAGVPITMGTGAGELNLTNTASADNILELTNFFRTTYPFNIDTNIIVSDFGPIAIVCVEWCEYGTRENFIFEPIDGPVVFENLGADVTIPDGFKFVYQLLCLDENKENPKSICPMQQRPLSLEANGVPQQMCIELQNELSNQVYTTVPKCDEDLIVNESMTKWVQLTYSYVERNRETNCGVVYAPFQYTDPLLIINQAINLEDGENAASLYRLEGNLGEIKFLTSRNTSDIRVCLGDCDWLFAAAFFNEFNDLAVTYSVRYRFYGPNATPLGTITRDIDTDGVLQIPAGPKSILTAFFPPGATLNPSLCYYEIQLNFLFAGSEIPYTEVATFRVDQNCCCDTNIFYLDPKGGYSRMGFECVENQNFVDTGTEICLDVPCGDYESEMMSGKSRVDSEGYTTMTLVTPKMKKTDATMCELRAFKSSEKKYYIFTDKQGGETNRRVTTVPGTTRIMEKDGKVTLTITVIESQNYKVISEK